MVVKYYLFWYEIIIMITIAIVSKNKEFYFDYFEVTNKLKEIVLLFAT